MSETTKRAVPYPAFLVLCIAVLAILAWCSGPVAVAASDFNLARFLEQSRLRRAEHQARRFCRRLRCPAPFVIEVVKALPGTEVARAARREDGVCRLRFLPASVTDDLTIAHEVCHCALDYGVMNEFGYVRGMTPAEVKKREAQARSCARGLMEYR